MEEKKVLLDVYHKLYLFVAHFFLLPQMLENNEGHNFWLYGANV